MKNCLKCNDVNELVLDWCLRCRTTYKDEYKKIYQKNYRETHKTESKLYNKDYHKEYYKENRKKILLKNKLRDEKFPHLRRANSRKHYIEVEKAKRKENRDEWIERDRIRANTLKRKFTAWKRNSKIIRKGHTKPIGFDLTFDDIKDLPLVCYYSGEVLTLKCNKENTVSLDRKDNNQGYTKDNVCFCTKRINRMKSTLSDVEFINLCEKITEKHKQNK